MDLECIAAQFRGPVMIGDDGDTAGYLHHFVHTRNRQRLGAFEGFDAAAEHRRTRDHRRHQAFELHVDAEPGPPGDFLWCVQPFSGLADQFPVLGFFEFDRSRVGHG